MTKPVAGQLYTIVKGDTLWDIATAVYGSGFKYTVIWNANKSNLRSGDPHWIFPGEQLWIPLDPDRNYLGQGKSEKGKREFDPRNPLSIYIDGKQYIPVSASVIRTFDTCADGWNAVFRDNINDKDWNPQRQVFRPYGYTPAEVFIDNRSLGESIIYNVGIAGNSTEGKITAEGFSPSVDIVDSVAEPPYEATNITLEEWTRQLIKPFGLTFSTSECDQDAWAKANRRRYKRVKIGREEKVFEHLSEKYRQKGFVLSNSVSANLMVRSTPVVSEGIKAVDEFVDDYEKGAVPVWEFDSTFSGRDRYRVTLATGKGRRKHFRDRYVDPAVPRNRRTIFSLSSSEEADMTTAAESRARKAIEDALTFTVPTREWYSRDGILYEPGQYVIYKSRRAFLDKGIILMIRKVVYIQEDGGRRAELDLIPPTVYSLDVEVDDPWISAQ